MLLTCIKQHLSLKSSFCLFLSGRFTQVLLYFVIKIFVLSICEWPFYPGFTVLYLI